MNSIFNRYVTQEKEMLRRHQETLEALEDIDAGRIVDGEKAMNWLSRWGTDDEQ